MRSLPLLVCIISTGLLTACMETTSTQREYSDYRDNCRQYAELKMGSGIKGRPTGDAYKKSLLREFSYCMKKKGWSVTAPGDGSNAKAPPVDGSPDGEVTVLTAAPVSPVQQATPSVNTKRAAECAYARHAASHSSNARALAKACDLECKNQKRLAPDMPTPAACE